MKIKDLSGIGQYYEIMEDASEYFAVIAALLAVLLFAYTFREGLTDIAYLALKRWKQTLFVAICIGGGLFAGTYNSHVGHALNEYHFRMALKLYKESDDTRTAMVINECKKFVEAKLDGRKDYDESSLPFDGIIKIGVSSYWDTCADTFGMNYWKHEIFIRGEEGGPMLCKVYRNDKSYRSGNVESWCATVLAPGKKI